MATRKTEILNDILVQIHKLSMEANDQSSKCYEKLVKGETDNSDYARHIGIQIGLNRVYSLICDLYDDSSEGNK